MPVTLPELVVSDVELTGAEIVGALRRDVGEVLRRGGLVVAMSGGIDSSVCAGLAARALGPERVLGLALPERESDPASLDLAAGWAGALGIKFAVEDITPTLQACGAYEMRDRAVRQVVSGFGAGWRCKLTVDAGGADRGGLTVCYLVTRAPDGTEDRVRLPAPELRAIIAATNCKQRVRKLFEYRYADAHGYAVLGTPNRLEYDQGFFVKGGDGLADVKPIAHLYKRQVYELAEWLGVPREIRERPPTTDTYSLPQSQEEFFFSVPLAEMDVALEALDAGASLGDVAKLLGRPEADVARLARDIAARRRNARVLDRPALLVRPVPSMVHDRAAEPVG